MKQLMLKLTVPVVVVLFCGLIACTPQSKEETGSDYYVAANKS